MSGDLKFIPPDTGAGIMGPADIQITSGYTLAEDKGLENALEIALFTDRRAEAEDPLPFPGANRRGHFIDTLEPRPVGSKVWLLSRSNLTPDTLRRAQQYFEEAANDQIIAGGLAQSVTVSTTKNGGQMDVSASVLKLDGNRAFFSYSINWANQLDRG